jgi:serine/threonine-protein kinase
MTDQGPNTDGEHAQAVEGEGSSISTDATMLREGSSLPPAGHDQLIGQVVAGRYRVEAMIGQGGMGRVYRAVHVHMHKTVALKVLRPEMTVVRGVLARFEREAVAAGRISHPNVAAATDFGRIGTDGPFYLVLEYVDGKNLRREIKAGPFSVQRALAVAVQACEGLVAAHQQSIIHRDLKPDNIMLVDDNGRDLVKVLDFGIAKVTDAPAEAGEHQTRYGVVMGTPRYMSPEQAAGGTVDHRTDLYALGVILYEMLSGQAPFVASGLNAVLSQQLVNDPPPLPPHVPRDLVKVCFQLLARDAEGRPESAAAVLEMLRAVRVDTQTSAARSSVGAVGRAVQLKLQSLGTAAFTVWSPVWRKAKAHVPALEVFDRRVGVAGRSFTWGTLALTSVAAACLVTLVVTLRSSPPASAPVIETPVAAQAKATPPESKPVPKDVSREDLEDLLAIPVFKRDKHQWLTIAAGHAQYEEWKQSVAAYRNALQLEPSLKNDYQLVQRLRDLAVIHEVYEGVSNIALNLMGPPGMDLMYDVWQATRDDDTKQAIAANALKNLGIFRLRGASPALRVALALQFSKLEECEEFGKALTDALKQADERAVRELEKLRVTTGCGVSKKKDCYPCLRERGADIDTAIKLAKSRKAPRFDGEKYVPGWGG